MNIFFHTGPLSNDHHVRGIGSYTRSLLDALKHDSSIRIFAAESMPNNLPIDIIHYPFFDLFSRTLSIHPYIPTVVMIHDVIPLLYPAHFPVGIRGSISLFFQKKLLNRVAAIITNSHTSKRDIIQYLQVSEKRIHVVPLAAGTKYRVLENDKKNGSDLRKKYALPKTYFLYVGDVNWHKNIEGLIQAFSLFKNQHSSVHSDTGLILAGRAFLDTSLVEVLQINACIRNLQLDGSIVRVGYVPTQDLVSLYNQSVAYVHPSRYEGFGFPVIEAMKCGVPVISTVGGSLKEFSEGIAEIVDPKPDTIACGMGTVFQYSKSTRALKIKQGLVFAREYSWEKTAAETKKVYMKYV